jgi:hypothetical protein
MNRIAILITFLLITDIIHADSSDWQDDSWDNRAIFEMEKENDTFKKMEIKNRSKKKYKDKVYKYIEDRDYSVENNNIEIATVELSDDIRGSDIKVNVLTENLKVEGDRYRGNKIDLKRNEYKHFVKHDDSSSLFLNSDDSEDGDSNIEKKPKTIIEQTDPLYTKVKDDDVSELEVIDLRDKPKTKEVNVYIKNTTIRVGASYED